ncbi:ABC transporter substrate-binding protein [Sphingomonas naphthae]|uniref:Probable sugar-binding periplasmic protein n=1 Tax=Sphingomonas naphthae TaxID=1813468 RepID=A0ABY7TIW4_9SPHN|nr:ABC transporter substrate-binding protein [Sphingomonas naphthae]WCT73084.1 ABC transporter substrate-binding protein [Sphingomonas naphthae]
MTSRRRAGAGFVTALALCLAGCGRKDDGRPVAEVIHSWTSGGESAAIHEIVAAYEKRGGRWTETAVTGIHAGRALAISRIAGGQPPTAMQWAMSRAVQDFGKQGVLEPLDARARREGWQGRYSPYIYRQMQANGHIVMEPLAIHGGNWLFISRQALDAIDAKPPENWDEFFDIAARLRAKGFVPLAFSGEAWTQTLVFYNVMLGVGGKAFYRRVMDRHDASAVSSPTMRRVFDIFGRLRDEVDAGVSSRTWNAASGMVIAGKAAMQIGGDWTKAEFIAAGQQAGRDFACVPTPGTRGAYIIYGESLVFPLGRGDRGRAAREMLLDVLNDPALIQRFSAKKGGVPARLDVQPIHADACTRFAAETLADPDSPVPNGLLAWDSDTEGELRDIIAQYWVRSLSTDAAIRSMAKVIHDAA